MLRARIPIKNFEGESNKYTYLKPRPLRGGKGARARSPLERHTEKRVARSGRKGHGRRSTHIEDRVRQANAILKRPVVGNSGPQSEFCPESVDHRQKSFGLLDGRCLVVIEDLTNLDLYVAASER